MKRAWSAIALALVPLSGCMVGPKYKTPAAIVAPSFKEAPPASSESRMGGSQVSQATPN
jgi:hypothetical protein